MGAEAAASRVPVPCRTFGCSFERRGSASQICPTFDIDFCRTVVSGLSDRSQIVVWSIATLETSHRHVKQAAEWHAESFKWSKQLVANRHIVQVRDTARKSSARA